MSADARFPIVYADFPWSYRQKGITRSGGIKPVGSAAHYETMSLETIKQFPIHDILAADGILFLWVPVPQKFDAVCIVEGWNQLQYKTTIFWRKLNKGLGHWARGCVEELWLLVKGDVKALHWQGLNILEEYEDKKDPGWFPVGWIKSKIGVHSKKPHRMYDMIEEMTAPFPALKKKVELFATETREGWTSVGWDIGSDVYEFANHLRIPKQLFEPRCSICGWPLAISQKEGCIEGDCSLRPRPKTRYDTYRARLEGQLKPFKVAA